MGWASSEYLPQSAFHLTELALEAYVDGRTNTT